MQSSGRVCYFNFILLLSLSFVSNRRFFCSSISLHLLSSVSFRFFGFFQSSDRSRNLLCRTLFVFSELFSLDTSRFMYRLLPFKLYLSLRIPSGFSAISDLWIFVHIIFAVFTGFAFCAVFTDLTVFIRFSGFLSFVRDFLRLSSRFIFPALRGFADSLPYHQRYGN